MDSVQREALDDIVMQMINANAKTRGRIIDFKEIQYGYRHVNPLYGPEYILDLLLLYKKHNGKKMTVPMRRHAYLQQTFSKIQLREHEELDAQELADRINQDSGSLSFLSNSLKKLVPFQLPGSKNERKEPKDKINILIPLSGRFDMFSNPDKVKQVELMKDYRVKYPKADMQILPVSGEFSRALALEKTGFWRNYGFGITCIYKGDLVRVGGFDVSIQGWGLEDVDLFNNVAQEGLKMFRSQEVGVVHVHHPVFCDPDLDPKQYKMCLGSKASTVWEIQYGYRHVNPLYGPEYILDLLLLYKKHNGKKMTVPMRRHAYLQQTFSKIQLREHEELDAQELADRINQDSGSLSFLSNSLKKLVPFQLPGSKNERKEPKDKINILIPLSGRFDMFSNPDKVKQVELMKDYRVNQYDPKIVYSGKVPSDNHFAFTQKTGFWRNYGFGITCIYKGDLVRVGGFDVSIQGWGLEDVDPFNKAVQAGLKMFRSQEVGVVHVHHPVFCDPDLDPKQYKMCLGSKASTYGSTQQLAEMWLAKNNPGYSKSNNNNGCMRTA
ncbi:Chondroitin sulfate synthase 1 [Heterocephalus glaber]|uniref:Hexosyltransferase n=1 Tax=Heterocephalus glaber TaxID=10181 RepID=G5BQD3_HETGA|nr:Chondroitin sulfate synthase 1 [Heterocephalus glaber]